MELRQELKDAIELLRNAEIDGSNGLTQELFWMISALIPIPNVDILIVNEKGQILLSRRNDGFFEKSWHIPGGCLRYGERLLTRVQETARRELGCEVVIEPDPLAVREVLRGENSYQRHPKERGHNIAILYRCKVPSNYQINNGDKSSDDDGYLKWFDQLPSDFMKIQMVYSDILHPWTEENGS